MQRHHKLNNWALVLGALSLIPFTCLLNSGGWYWFFIGMALILGSGSFFVWSLRVEGRQNRG